LTCFGALHNHQQGSKIVRSLLLHVDVTIVSHECTAHLTVRMFASSCSGEYLDLRRRRCTSVDNCVKKGFIICNFHPIFSFHGATAPSVPGPPYYRRRHDHAQKHHTRQDSSGRVIISSQKPLPNNTQHSRETDVHAFRLDSKPQSQKASGRRPTP
jgi:hypothetical protein